MITFETINSNKDITGYRFASSDELKEKYSTEPFNLPVLETPIVNCQIDDTKVYPSCFGELLTFLGMESLVMADSEEFVLGSEETLTERDIKTLLYLIEMSSVMVTSQKAYLYHLADDAINARNLELMRLTDKLKKMW